MLPYIYTYIYYYVCELTHIEKGKLGTLAPLHGGRGPTSLTS